MINQSFKIQKGGKIPKPRVAFYWYASCGGYEEVVVDRNEDLLKVTDAVDIVLWPVVLDFKKSNVEPWTYVRFSHLRNTGWKGFVDGEDSGVFRVAPLARLNASDGMATPLAQQDYQKMYEALVGKPVHSTLAFHWARLIETLYACERMLELAQDPEFTSSEVRNIPTAIPEEWAGVEEAPRSTLFHHHKTDGQGVLTEVNLIVATQNNSAPICMSIEKAARSLISNGEVSDGILDMIEMAFRACDPCHACATHSLPRVMPLQVNVFDCRGDLVRTLKRNSM